MVAKAKWGLYLHGIREAFRMQVELPPFKATHIVAATALIFEQLLRGVNCSWRVRFADHLCRTIQYDLMINALWRLRRENKTKPVLASLLGESDHTAL